MRFLQFALPFFFLSLFHWHTALAAAAFNYYGPSNTLPGVCGGAANIALDPQSGTVFVSCSKDNTIASWAPGANAPVTLGPCIYSEGLFWDAARGSLVAACYGSGASSGAVKLFYPNNSSAISLPGVSNCALHYVAVDVDSTVYASCDLGGLLKWTDITQNPIRLADGGLCTYSRQFAINPVTGDIFLSCMGSNSIIRWAKGSSTAVPHASCSGADGLIIAPNGDLYAGCGNDNKLVRFPFNPVTGQYNNTAQTLNGRCSGSDGINLAWASNGLFATCAGENLMKYWSVDALRLNSGPAELGSVVQASIAVTPFGERVFSGDWWIGAVQEWDLVG